ncbi:hypothetical protein BD770DRAFT_393680 [Pilaira anomala]|nr:hypothetical protein BD770DRAFT_393680 [Pilaira anomala]
MEFIKPNNYYGTDQINRDYDTFSTKSGNFTDLSQALAKTSLAMSVLLIVFMGYYYFKSPIYRNNIWNIAAVSALLSLSLSIIAMEPPTKQSIGSAFYGLYICFAHVTILYAFQRITKKMDHRYVKILVYLGYSWAIVMILTGIVITVTIKKTFMDLYKPIENLFDLEDLYHTILFFRFSTWGFIIIIWICLFILQSTLSKTSRISMSAFNLLVSISSITILAFSLDKSASLQDLIAVYVFRDITIIFALLVAVYYSPHWLKDSLIDLVENDVESVQSNNSVTQNGAPS